MQAAMSPDYPAEIVLVISNRADAKGLESAAKLNVPTRVISETEFSSREEHDSAIDAALREVKSDIVCLAGYMRLLTPEFVKRWQGRMINIHPALLPSFKGLNTHERALAAGVRIHGCTVHFVTATMDEGPIIMQAAVPVVTGDTGKSLAERVLKAEHMIYPRALAMLARGAVRMTGGNSVFSGKEEEPESPLVISPGLRANTKQDQ
jgi:formyltetrahydrofolate-dependent phosphoribosylglycinamide formyltransferase